MVLTSTILKQGALSLLGLSFQDFLRRGRQAGSLSRIPSGSWCFSIQVLRQDSPGFPRHTGSSPYAISNSLYVRFATKQNGAHSGRVDCKWIVTLSCKKPNRGAQTPQQHQTFECIDPGQEGRFRDHVRKMGSRGFSHCLPA